MAVFSAPITFPQGFSESPAAPVPGGTTGAIISLTADGWPAGSYNVRILLSSDAGATYPEWAGATWVSPFSFPPGKTHACSLSMKIAANITHAKMTVDAAASFTTTVTISVQ